MIKTLSKVRIEGIYLNIIKPTYDKLTENIIINGEKLNALPLNSGKRPLLYNIILEVLATTIRQEKEIKKNPTRKERSKTVCIQALRGHFPIASLTNNGEPGFKGSLGRKGNEGKSVSHVGDFPDSPVAKILNAGGPGSIPGHRTRSHMLQLGVSIL